MGPSLHGHLSCNRGPFRGGQSIWVDETTQLTGLKLPFDEQLAWLLGRSDLILGVPPDRMPPASYWIGSVWSALFGVAEGSMRWMGIVAVGLAAPALYMSGRVVSGILGGFICLGLVLLSGSSISAAASIRAYPLFVLFNSWAALFYCLLIVRGDSPLRYAGLMLCLLLAGYTHFFGVIAAVCIGAALLMDRVRRKMTIWPVVVLAFVGFLSLGGLAPFVVAAIDVSGSGTVGHVSILSSVADAARLAFRACPETP